MEANGKLHFILKKVSYEYVGTKNTTIAKMATVQIDKH